ncbi:MAG: hypothetical protein GY906_02775, partial [bacterium]|nr:hypothetical protein [bacterium]
GRLCDQISTRERQVFPGGLGHFKIIGVVGSDVYDKQLILQALRARFPRAVFFTTDLDARLTHNNQYHWSRNLLIASSFGLSLNQSLQGAIPPFRGSYQTSTFLACQLALGPIQLKDPETGTSVPLSSKHIEKHLVVPRLYEVARGGAYDISRFDNPNQWTLHSPVKQKSQSILGLRTDMLLASGFSALLFSAAIVGCFMRKKRSKARLSAELRRRVITLSISFLLMLTILTFVVWLDSSKLGGEPFELLQGVSVWPTQFLRFAVGFMCIAFLLSAACDLRRSNDYLERRYRFSEEESTKHQIVNDDASLADDAAPEDSGPEAGDAAAPAPTDPTRPAKEIWRSTRELGKREMRLKRILLALLIYIVFTNVAMMLFGPPASPVRSSTARITDFLMIVFSSSTLAVLSLFVLDTNRLCARMIRQFKTTNTSWPPTAIKRVKQERGLEREEAAEWLEVQFIAERTAVVGRFVVLPFIAFFFLLISRNSYFDLWLWPFSLLLVFGVLSVFIIASGLILRRAAESSRQTSLLILSKLRSRFTGSEDKKEQRRHAQIELTIEELKNLKTGAFAPWSQHPLVRAIILPFGGAGTVLVLEVLSKLGM